MQEVARWFGAVAVGAPLAAGALACQYTAAAAQAGEVSEIRITPIGIISWLRAVQLWCFLPHALMVFAAYLAFAAWPLQAPWRYDANSLLGLRAWLTGVCLLSISWMAAMTVGGALIGLRSTTRRTATTGYGVAAMVVGVPAVVAWLSWDGSVLREPGGGFWVVIGGLSTLGVGAALATRLVLERVADAR